MPKSAQAVKLHLGPALCTNPQCTIRHARSMLSFVNVAQCQLLQKKIISTFSTASTSLLHIPRRRCTLQVAMRGISATVTPCTLQMNKGKHVISRTNSYGYGENLILPRCN